MTVFAPIAPSMPLMMRSAASIQPRWRSIISPERMTEPGLTLSRFGVLRRGAVRRLEDGVAGDVVDVAAGRDADAADLRRERVGEVVAVEVQRRDDVELLRAREHLLERDVGDGVLDEEHLLPLAVAVRRPELERRLDLLRDLGLHVRRRHVVAGLDLAARSPRR